MISGENQAKDLGAKNPPSARIPQSPPLDAERRKALENFMPDFVLEFTDQIETLENAAIKLEQNPAGPSEINDCFRTIHTIKGVANALGFMALGYLCHSMETALAVYREKKEALPRGLISLLYAFNDALRKFKSVITATLDDSGVDIGLLVDKLESPWADFSTGHDPYEDLGETSPIGPQLAAQAEAFTEKIGAIRVTVERLDALLNDVGELSLLRNKSQQLAAGFLRGERTESLIESFNSLASGLDSVTSRLQAGVMRSRMLPVRNIFKKYARVVRDLSAQLGKEAELVITGADTELDKNQLEAVSDPLLHIIRNCMDHGLETPEARQRAGKPRRGSIRLQARQEGNSIVLEVSDDGKGIDVNALAEKAAAGGVISREKAAGMSAQEKMDLIFLPGVSTAGAVTDVSGRGVGMDVVKTNIEKLNGGVFIDSQPGVGTKITLQIPLTLAIMPILLCRAGAAKIGFPLYNVEKTDRINPVEIITADECPFIDTREGKLPLLFLPQALSLEDGQRTASDEVGVVVVKPAVRRFGLVVDKILGRMEILLKPLDALRGIFDPPYILGGAILGDGSICFILDVMKLAPLIKAPHIKTAIAEKENTPAEPEELALIFGEGKGGALYAAEAKWIGGVVSVDPAGVRRHGGLWITGRDGAEIPVRMISPTRSIEGINRKGDYYMILLRKEGMQAGLLAEELVGLRKVPKKIIDASIAGGSQPETLYALDGRPVVFFDPVKYLAAPNAK